MNYDRFVTLHAMYRDLHYLLQNSKEYDLSIKRRIRNQEPIIMHFYNYERFVTLDHSLHQIVRYIIFCKMHYFSINSRVRHWEGTHVMHDSLHMLQNIGVCITSCYSITCQSSSGTHVMRNSRRLIYYIRCSVLGHVFVIIKACNALLITNDALRRTHCTLLPSAKKNPRK